MINTAEFQILVYYNRRERERGKKRGRGGEERPDSQFLDSVHYNVQITFLLGNTRKFSDIVADANHYHYYCNK